MNWPLLVNSLLVAGSAMGLALLGGAAVAVVLASAGRRLRGLLLALTVAALALPSFLATNCWIDLLGANGVLHRWLPLNIFSLPGAAWILALLLWPIPALGIFSAWQKLEPAHLELDPELRGWNLFRYLLLPAARNAMVITSAITFALAMNNFAVPAILQVKVYPAEVWVQFSTNLDARAALRLGWPIIAAPLLLVLLLRRGEISWPRASGMSVAPQLRRQLGRAWAATSRGLACLVVTLSLAVPLAQLAGDRRTWVEFLPALEAGQSAMFHSLLYAAGAAVLAVALGTWLARVRSLGWMWFFFLVPGVLLGIGAVSAFNRPGLDWFSRSAAIVVAALAVRHFALAHALARAAHQSLDRELVDAARVDGAAGLALFRHAVWPQLATPLAAAAYVVYVLSLWDVESILLVVPPGGETLAVRVFNLLHYGHNSHVNALCLLLLLLALAPMLAWMVFRFGRGLAGGASERARPEGPPFIRPGRSPGSQGKAGPALKGRNSSPVFPKRVCSALAGPVPFSLLTRGCASLRPGRMNCAPAGLWFGGVVLLVAFLMAGGCSRESAERSTATALHTGLFARVAIIGSRGTGPGQFNKPRSLTCDSNDNLYVVDMTGRVQKFSPEGKFILSWQMPQTDLGKPKGLCRDREGNIVVLEPHYQRVNHFTPEGKLVAQWGVKGTNAGELTLPRAVAVDTRNNVIVSEYTLVDRVQKFSARGGRVLNAWGTPGLAPGEFNRAEGVGLDSADRIYIADSCNHRVQVFSPEGKFLRAYGRAGTAAGEMSYPYDIAVDAQGRQFVCEFGNSRIQVFDANDQPLEVIGQAGLEPGRFANPWSLALDSKGNLYVADSMNHRVQKLVRRASSKPQAPSSKETPNTKHQARTGAAAPGAPMVPRVLVLGTWSFPGTWSLELGASYK